MYVTFPCVLQVTHGYLASGYLVLSSGYFWLLLVTSGSSF